MIFLTVGSELPFDRLVRAVDEWCGNNPSADVFGQIGDPGEKGYQPRHFAWQPFITPDEYRQRYEEAELIIGHAGMGSIITALVKAKPILILPRRAMYQETRNDHQFATAARFACRPGIMAAEDETKVGTLLDQWEEIRSSLAMKPAGKYAEERLIASIHQFIFRN